MHTKILLDSHYENIIGIANLIITTFYHSTYIYCVNETQTSKTFDSTICVVLYLDLNESARNFYISVTKVGSATSTASVQQLFRMNKQHGL